MDIQGLNDQFGLPGVLAFEQDGELVLVRVTSSAANATVYLHGAHITHWQPEGHDEVLYLSPTSAMEAGKAIRGGVPVCFPWFGPRSDGGAGPMHGFARIQDWEVAFAALVPSVANGDEVHLTFTLAPNELSRSLGWDNFRVAYQLIIGRTLTLRLTVANTGTTSFKVEEALHTYFAVPDVRTILITGVEGAEYIDKTDSFARKHRPQEPLRFTAATDSMFPEHTGDCTVAWPGGGFTNHKSGSGTTVIWNPWTTNLPADVPEGGWEKFVCVEAANAGMDAVKVSPGETHTMEAKVILS